MIASVSDKLYWTVVASNVVLFISFIWSQLVIMGYRRTCKDYAVICDNYLELVDSYMLELTKEKMGM
jgi:uncharacterized protein (UPF0262 family)